MTVRYGGATNRHTYLCSRQLTDYGGAICYYVAGPTLDQCLVQQLFQALTPSRLEVALAAAQQLEGERADLDRHWQQRLERAAYAADRAARQYRLAEPEHRLVVRQLERAWNDCLSTQQQLEEAYHRFRATQPRHVTQAEQMTIRQLAADIPALWDAPTTTNAERKDILRQVRCRVVVTTQGTTEQVQVSLEWAGGMQTQLTLIRPVARLKQLSYYPQLCERIRVLSGEGHSAGAIAEALNAEGYRPPKRRDRFGEQGGRDLLHRLGLSEASMRCVPQARLPAHAWYVQPLARLLEMPIVTLHHWTWRGWVQAVQHVNSRPIMVHDGIITNDKFCCTRRLHLRLRASHRPQQACNNSFQPAMQADKGGDHETCLDGAPPEGATDRCAAPLGSGLSAPAPVCQLINQHHAAGGN
jgi:hypothetical protein